MSTDQSEAAAQLCGRFGLAALALTPLMTAGAATIFWQRMRCSVRRGSDPLACLGGARSLPVGDGCTRTTDAAEKAPITHFPPLYAVSLAATGRLLNHNPFLATRDRRWAAGSSRTAAITRTLATEALPPQRRTS